MTSQISEESCHSQIVAVFARVGTKSKFCRVLTDPEVFHLATGASYRTL